jgi:hypothetical protein
VKITIPLYQLIQAWAQAQAQTWDQAWAQAQAQTWDQAWAQARAQTWDQAWAQARAQARDQTWDQAWAQAWAQARDQARALPNVGKHIFDWCMLRGLEPESVKVKSGIAIVKLKSFRDSVDNRILEEYLFDMEVCE